MDLIRRLTIGKDYKDGMHYSVGQSVYGGNVINSIIEENDFFFIYIEKDMEVKLWKKVNKAIGLVVEYDLKY